MSRLLLVGLVLATAALAQTKRIAFIDFFGHAGVDTAALRRQLDIQEGATFLWPGAAKQNLGAAVKRALGREPSNVAVVCCTDATNDWMIFIGLVPAGEGLPERAAPKEKLRLPEVLLKVHAQIEQLLGMPGVDLSEDDSNGYALNGTGEVRQLQYRFRDLARQHEANVRRVLRLSGDAEQRAIAATAMGYIEPSQAQVEALVAASLDPDDRVRNDAVRALGVLASSRPRWRRFIPPDLFVSLLSSGVWTDRNKAVWLVAELLRDDDGTLAALLRERSIVALKEMAEWRNPGHAYSARQILTDLAR